MSFPKQEHLNCSGEVYSSNMSNGSLPCEPQLCLEKPCEEALSDNLFRCKRCNLKYSKSELLTHSNENRFICGFCKMSFSEEKQLSQHLKVHLSNVSVLYESVLSVDHPIKQEVIDEEFHSNLYACQVCNMEYKTEHELLIHSSLHEKVIHCSSCNISFSEQEQLNHHLALHSTTDIPNFPITNESKISIYEPIVKLEVFDEKRSSTEASIKVKDNSDMDEILTRFFSQAIIKYQKKRKLLSCEICHNKFLNKGYFIQHLFSHTSESNLKCVFCRKTFHYSYLLSSHIWNLHINKPTFFCDICEVGFSSNLSLNAHLVYHPTLGSFACNFCPKTFVSKHDLKMHLKVHASGGQFICWTCEEKFSSMEHLNVHLHLHASKKRIFCDICDKEFSDEHRLKVHVQDHTEKLFNCVICKEQFDERSAFLYHVGKKHKNLKSFPCDSCSKKFSFISSYLKHIRYRCHVCKKEIQAKQKLIAHLENTHPMEKPFKCLICKEAFCSRKQLYIHQEQHTVNNLFFCSLCEKGFKRIQGLKLHQDKAHPIKKEKESLA